MMEGGVAVEDGDMAADGEHQFAARVQSQDLDASADGLKVPRVLRSIFPLAGQVLWFRGVGHPGGTAIRRRRRHDEVV